MEFVAINTKESKKIFTIFFFTLLVGTMMSFYPSYQFYQIDSQSDGKNNDTLWNEPHQDNSSTSFEKIKRIGIAVITTHGAYQFVKEIFEINTNISNWKPLPGFFDSPDEVIIPDPPVKNIPEDNILSDKFPKDVTSPIIKVPIALYGYILDDEYSILENPSTELQRSIMLSDECLTQFESDSYFDSLNCYLQLLENDTNNPAVLNNIGVQFLILNHPNDALNYFTQAYAVQLKYENYHVLHNLAITNAILGNDELSQQYYQLAIRQNYPFYNKNLESFFIDFEKIKDKNIDFDFSTVPLNVSR